MPVRTKGRILWGSPAAAPDSSQGERDSLAALSLRNSATALGAYYRRIARRIGGDVAVFAMARKLVTLIYRLLRWGQQYVDEEFEKRYQAIRITALKAKAKELGFELVQNA
jgi:hypothetical protein